MKKAVFFLFVVVLLFSCSKEKQPDIVGAWAQTALYDQKSPGVFEWVTTNRWPLLMTFKSEGEYSTLQEMFGDRGIYKYSPTTRELKLTSDFSATSVTQVVSFLDENSMEIDYFNNGVMSRRLRFTRKE